MRFLLASEMAMPHATQLRVPGFVLSRGFHHRGDEIAPHAHDDPSLCYVLDGRFTEYSAGVSTDCMSEEFKLTPAGERHWNRFAAASHGIRIEVDRRAFSGNRIVERLLGDRLHMQGVRERELMHRLLLELRTMDPAAPLAVEGLLLELVAALARDARPKLTPVLPPWLREADEMIRESYTTDITLSGLAHTVNVAPATLARGYRSAFRTTIGDRVRQLRVEQAGRELLHSRDAIAVIAVRTGFYDQSHFTHIFRRRFGVTPAQYRRLLQPTQLRLES